MFHFLKKSCRSHFVLSVLFIVLVAAYSSGQSCPVVNFIGDDFVWNSNLYGNGINTMAETSDGFLAMGRNNADDDFQSVNGQNLIIQDQGAYLIKYTNNSNVEWFVTIKYPDGTEPNEIDAIEAAVEDLDGNIYLTGFSSGNFYDTSGNEISLYNPTYTTNFQKKAGFIIKLDKDGQLLWYMQTAYTYPEKLFIDNQNNLISINRNYEAYDHDIYLNGVFSETILKREVDDSYGASILKFSANGNILWSNILDSWNSNGYIVESLDFDDQNNIYLIGYSELWTKIYSAGDTALKAQISRASSGNKISFLIKYNQQGQYLWNMKSEASNQYSTIRFNDLGTDDFGNSYITGKNNRVTGTGVHIFENTDGSTTTTSEGPYFVAKVDNTGVCKWVYGISDANRSEGHKVFVDDDEVYVVGEASVNNQDLASPTFFSANDENLSFEIGRSDIFMAVYDPLGNLKRIILNGNNGYFGSQTIQGFFKGSNDSFYLGVNMSWLDGKENYSHFGNQINTINGVEGTIVNFSEDCGTVINNTAVTAIVLDVTVNKVNCNGGTDGTILVNASGGTPPYLYELLTSESVLIEQSSTNIFDHLGAESYIVRIVDTNGDSPENTEVLLEEPSPIEIQIEQTGVTCTNTDSGSLTVSATGGFPPYQYRLNDGNLVNSNVFSGLGLDTFTIGVIDVTGCENFQSVTMIENGPLVFEGIDFKLVSCKGGDDGMITINASGGHAPYQYTVDGENYLESNQISGLSAGVYSVTIKDNTNCVSEIIQVKVDEVNSFDFDGDGIGDDCDIDRDGDGVLNEDDLCEETPLGSFVGVDGCIVFNLPAENFQVLATGESCIGSANGSIEVVALATRNYIGTLTGESYAESKEFDGNVVFGGLSQGDYRLCITIKDQTDYQKCFDLKITEPLPLEIYAELNVPNRMVTLKLDGGKQYFIAVNNTVYTTNKDEIRVSLNQKRNVITVKTDQDCQGIYTETFNLTDETLIYPNPVKNGLLTVACETKNNQTPNMTLFDNQGRKVDFGSAIHKQNQVELNLNGLSSGLYYLTIQTNNSIETKHIIIR